MENLAQKNLVRRYLLGDLPEADQLALEQKYFAESELFEQVWAAENELVDEYVRGSLRGNDRTFFERNYLTSPKHQERVATARLLLHAADASLSEDAHPAKQETKAHSSWWENLMSFLTPPQLVWGGALALLLLAFGVWFYTRVPQSPEIQVAGGKTAPTIIVPEGPVPATPQPTGAATASATPLPMSSIRQPSPTISPATNKEVPSILAFALVGAGIRGGSRVQRLAIPEGTKQVRLQMPLDGEDYSRYQVQVRTVDSKEVFRQTSLSPSASKKSVAALIPATKLSSGDYVVTLSGLSQSGDLEEVNKFYFRVSQK
ncbi:MAG: hypothetical protein JST84_32500 [Acidobacteria bacterium]|nr:hypothetical protein [Acidobacteriota bacterium]